MKKGFLKGVVLGSLVILGLGVATLSPASAHGMHHRMMKCMIMHGGPIPFYLLNQDRLKLSREQVRTLLDLKQSFRKNAVMEKAKIHVLRIDIMALMHHRTIDTARVDSDLDKIFAHKRILMKDFVDTVARAKGVLTPAQYEKAGKLWRAMILAHHGMRTSRR
ncbi:MAG: periplasmic heavy metal sensor [Nitrospiraceae bacterium]|jgi:hypothetical protein|nr:periplasmic heavy metal sensor [Nitrospiraceae bacterium]